MATDETGYFIIYSSEDGIEINGPLDEAMVLERITPSAKREGLTHYGKLSGFHDQVPGQDKGHFTGKGAGRKLLVIKGTIVVPKAETVVTAYKLG